MAAAVRQTEIAEEQVKGVLAGQFQCRGHVAGHLDRVPIRGQHHLHHLRRDAVVFDQQDAQWGGRHAAGAQRVGVPRAG